MIDSLHFLSLALNDGDNASLPAAGKLVTAALKRGRERGFDLNSFRMTASPINGKTGFVADQVGWDYGFHKGGVIFLESGADMSTILHEGIHATQAGVSGGNLDWYLSYSMSSPFYTYEDSPWEKWAFKFSDIMILNKR